MHRDVEISTLVLREAKRQYYAGEMELFEYQEILTILYDKLNDLEEDLAKKNYLILNFKNPNFKLKLLDMLNFTLAMN